MKSVPLLLLLAAACTQPLIPRPPSAVDGGEPSSDFCADYAQAYCEREVRCGGASSQFRDDCVSYALGNCAGAAASQALGYKQLDPVKAAECLTWLAGDCRRQADRCLEAYVPMSKTGGGCLVPSDCLSAADNCDGPSCQKTCRPAGALGQQCRQNASCDIGLRCDWPTKTCVVPKPPGPAGTDCGNYGTPECDDTAYCDFAAPGGYKCVALPVVGQTCRPYEPRCAGSAWCNGTVCQQPTTRGGTCSSDGMCVSGDYCDTTCKPRKATSGSCGRTGECGLGLRCIGQICLPPRAEGESCTASEHCTDRLACDRLTRTCVEYAWGLTARDSCTNDRILCGADLRCAGAAVNPDGGVGTRGTCTALVPCSCAENETCQRDGDGGFTCLALTAAGELCTGSGQCAPLNGCIPQADGKARCAKLGDLGDACRITKTLDDTCLFPLSCDGNTCEHFGGATEWCSRGSSCWAGGCDPQTSVCGAKLPEGAACGYNSASCESGTCLFQKCTAICR